MTLKESILLRDTNRPILVNRPFDNNKSGWDIRDVIVASEKTAGYVYTKMWNDDITNETALKLFPIEENEYDVFIISHQWSWGSGDLLYERFDSYIKTNPI